MEEKTETIDVKVKSKNTYNPPSIGEDTPFVEITTLKIEPLTDSTFQTLEYQFFSGLYGKIEEVEGYGNYERFKNSGIGDLLRIVYFSIGRFVSLDIPWERIDSTVLSIIRGDYVTSGGSYACHPANSAPIDSIENLTKNGKLNEGPSSATFSFRKRD